MVNFYFSFKKCITYLKTMSRLAYNKNWIWHSSAVIGPYAKLMNSCTCTAKMNKMQQYRTAFNKHNILTSCAIMQKSIILLCMCLIENSYSQCRHLIWNVISSLHNAIRESVYHYSVKRALDLLLIVVSSDFWTFPVLDQQFMA